jgi:hypothetical protein
VEFLKWARYHWDRLSAAILAGLGLLTLLLGYVGVSGTVYPAEQLPYMISGGILGLFFLGSAGVLYISADMRDEWRKLDNIDVTLKELVGTTTTEADETTAPVVASDEEPAPATTASPKAASGSTAKSGTPKAPRRTTRTTARQASGSPS